MEMKARCFEEPIVMIMPKAKEKLDLYIGLCNDEISGLGDVIREENVFLIKDVMLFSQEVTPGSTDLENEAISNFMVEAIQAGLDPVNLRLWWHSHVNGGCFWSGTDEDTVDRFKNDWFVSIVGNKKGEYMARVDIYEPFRVAIDELPIKIFNARNKKLKDQITAEIAKKVKKKVADYMGFGWPEHGKFNNPEIDFRSKKYEYQDWSSKSKKHEYEDWASKNKKYDYESWDYNKGNRTTVLKKGANNGAWEYNGAARQTQEDAINIADIGKKPGFETGAPTKKFAPPENEEQLSKEEQEEWDRIMRELDLDAMGLSAVK